MNPTQSYTNSCSKVVKTRTEKIKEDWFMVGFKGYIISIDPSLIYKKLPVSRDRNACKNIRVLYGYKKIPSYWSETQDKKKQHFELRVKADTTPIT